MVRDRLRRAAPPPTTRGPAGATHRGLLGAGERDGIHNECRLASTTIASCPPGPMTYDIGGTARRLHFAMPGRRCTRFSSVGVDDATRRADTRVRRSLVAYCHRRPGELTRPTRCCQPRRRWARSSSPRQPRRVPARPGLQHISVVVQHLEQGGERSVGHASERAAETLRRSSREVAAQNGYRSCPLPDGRGGLGDAPADCGVPDPDAARLGLDLDGADGGGAY